MVGRYFDFLPTSSGSWDIHPRHHRWWAANARNQRVSPPTSQGSKLPWCRSVRQTWFIELQDSWYHQDSPNVFSHTETAAKSTSCWKKTRPQQVAIWVLGLWGERKEKKKTWWMIMHCHGSSTRILSGFKSRWMMPLEWMYASLGFFRSQGKRHLKGHRGWIMDGYGCRRLMQVMTISHLTICHPSTKKGLVKGDKPFC